MSTRPHATAALFGWVALCAGAAGIGGAASARAPAFYRQLALPDWAPPAWLFGPVWTALYLMMAVAAWLVWRERGWAGARTPLVLFCLQLALNALWTWIFFAWRLGALAFADIIVLALLIVATMAAFARVSRFAAALLSPYLGWVTFATALTWSAWRANPALLR